MNTDKMTQVALAGYIYLNSNDVNHMMLPETIEWVTSGYNNSRFPNLEVTMAKWTDEMDRVCMVIDDSGLVDTEAPGVPNGIITHREFEILFQDMDHRDVNCPVIEPLYFLANPARWRLIFIITGLSRAGYIVATQLTLAQADIDEATRITINKTEETLPPVRAMYSVVNYLRKHVGCPVFIKKKEDAYAVSHLDFVGDSVDLFTKDQELTDIVQRSHDDAMDLLKRYADATYDAIMGNE